MKLTRLQEDAVSILATEMMINAFVHGNGRRSNLSVFKDTGISVVNNGMYDLGISNPESCMGDYLP